MDAFLYLSDRSAYLPTDQFNRHGVKWQQKAVIGCHLVTVTEAISTDGCVQVTCRRQAHMLQVFTKIDLVSRMDLTNLEIVPARGFCASPDS